MNFAIPQRRNLLLVLATLMSLVVCISAHGQGEILTFRQESAGVGSYTVFSLTPDGAGGYWIADPISHTVTRHGLSGVTTVGNGLATSVDGDFASASIAYPLALGFDPTSGNVYVGDGNRLRRIDVTGFVQTVAGVESCGAADGFGSAASFCGISGLTVDNAGNVFVADRSNQRIRKVTPAGDVTTVAGSTYGFADGVGAAAKFRFPSDVAFHPQGFLVVADYESDCIRKVTLDGQVTTLAGVPGAYGSTDGTGSQARFNSPEGVTVAPDGAVYVADSGNYGVRRVSANGVVVSVGGMVWRGTREGTGSLGYLNRPQKITALGTREILVSGEMGDVMRGTPSIADRATKLSSTTYRGERLQLGIVPLTATAWTWTLELRPAGSSAVIDDSSTVTPSIVPDVEGAYRIRLDAGIPSIGSSISYVEFTSACAAAPPQPAITLVSGANPSCPGQPVVLEATGSYDSVLWSNGATTRQVTISPSSDQSISVVGFVDGCKSPSVSYTLVVANDYTRVPLVRTGSWSICENTVGGRIYPYLNEPIQSYQWAYRPSTGGPITLLVNETGPDYWLEGADFAEPGNYDILLYATPYCGRPVVLSDPYWVQVNEVPTLAVQASGTVICGTSPITINATISDLSTISGYTFYLYRDGVYAGAVDGLNATFNVTVPGSYEVRLIDPNLCIDRSDPIVLTKETPAPSFGVAGGLSFCEGGSTRFDINSPNPTSTYRWSNGVVGTQLVVTQSGTYTVTETTQAGCSGTSTARIVTVYPLPEVAITPSGPTTFCAGGSVVLTASVGSAYLWSNGATTQSITVTQSGDYSVRMTNSYQCSNTSAVTTVTVNPPPVVTITPGSPTTFCEGGSVLLTASAGSSYLWSNGAITQSITVSQSGNYTVTVTNANGCAATSTSTTVTVNPLPAVTITPSGATTFCEGGSVVLTSSIGASYLWSNGATTRSITVTQSGSFSVRMTNVNGCSTMSAATAVTVNPKPVATITPGGSTTFCAGGSVELTSSPGASYLWSNGATSPSITITQSGSYSVSVTSETGCSTTSAATAVTVNPLPTATITPSGATTFCAGGSVALTASYGASYLWSNGATAQSINVTQSGNYSVTVTNASGCATTSAATAVTVNPVPEATITPSGPTTFCAGGSVVLTAPPGASYFWNWNGLTTQSITVTQSGNYSVTVTNASGCATSSAPTAVTVMPTPVATIEAQSTTFCEGGSISLVAFPPNSTYLWSNGATTQVITVTQPGDYSVTVSNANGCSSTSGTVAVTMNPKPAPTITASGPTTFCEGGSVVLTASPGYSYLWMNGATTQSITATQTGNNWVTVTNESGCSTTSAATLVVVNPLPGSAVTASGPTTFCEGGSVVLTAATGSSYLWSNGATTKSITVTQSGSYSVTVTAAGSCATTSAPTVVTVNPMPEATITAEGPISLCEGGSVVLTASAGASYLWSNGATTRSITVSTGGSYTVTVTSASGCAKTSYPQSVYVSSLPVVEIWKGGPVSFCEGGSVSLTSSITGTSYLWSNGATTRWITVSTPGNYTVTVTNDIGCQGTSAPVAVTVNTRPTAAVSGAGSICPGGSTTVQASLTGTAPWSITWSDGFVQNGIATSVASRSVNPSSTTSYSVTSVSDASCSGTSSGSAVVTVTPLPTAVVSGSATVCNGTQATITVALTGSGPWTLTWSDGFVQSGIATSPATRTVTPSTTTTYSVTAVSGASCAGTASGSATITVNQKPTITTQPVSKSIKKNTTTTLTVAATGTGTLSYQWYKGASGNTSTPVGTNSTSYTTPKLLVTTQYWVKVTNSCGSTNSVTATVTIR